MTMGCLDFDNTCAFFRHMNLTCILSSSLLP